VIEIVQGEKKYASELVQMAIPSFLDAHAHSAPKEEIDRFLSIHYSLKAFENELTNPELVYHLVFVDSELAGFSKIILNKDHLATSSKNTTKLDRIYISKNWYGRGLAQQLLRFIIDYSKQRDQQGMWLFTWIENHRAIGFYQKEGFMIVGSHDFKVSETHYNPNHVMYKAYHIQG